MLWLIMLQKMESLYLNAVAVIDREIEEKSRY
jgi:hypothetical protein